MTWTEHPHAPRPGTRVCRLDDLVDGIGTGFNFGDEKPFRLFVVRKGLQVWGYVNACSHFGVELNPGADHTFLNPDGTAIRCQHHGALFAIEDGRCLRGECDGEGLTPVPVRIRDGHLEIGEASL